MERAKEELEEFNGLCGAVYTTIEVYQSTSSDKAMLIPTERGSWIREIAWTELVAWLNSGEELQFHDLGKKVR